MWQTPERLPEPVNIAGARDHCPMLLRDGKTLCWASLRPGGFGKSDIWCAVRSADGSYTEPVNAGPSVNTAADEFHFQQDAQGAWIYFTSFRPGGLSGAGDIWATLPDGRGGYGDAVNLGPRVNSVGVPNTCPAFMPNGSMAQFTMDADGEIDIWVNDVVR